VVLSVNGRVFPVSYLHRWGSDPNMAFLLFTLTKISQFE
jgi:hypothetical protein